MIEKLIRYGIKREHGRCVEPQLHNITFPNGESVVPANTDALFRYLDTVTGYGCDIAQVRQWFDERGINGEVFGIDLNYGVEYSPEDARRIVERSLGNRELFDRCRVSQCNALELPFEDDYFNRVSSIALIHHFRREERRKHFEEAYRVLKNDGVIFGWTLSGEDIEEFTKLKYDLQVLKWKDEHEEGIKGVVLSYLDDSISDKDRVVEEVRNYNKQFYENVKRLLQQEKEDLTREEISDALVTLVDGSTSFLEGYSESVVNSLVEEREAYYQRVKRGLSREDIDERGIGRDVVLHFGDFYQKINKLMHGLAKEKRRKFSELDEKRVRDSILSRRLFFIDDLTNGTVREDLEEAGFKEFSVSSFVAPGYNIIRSLTFYAVK